MVRVINMAKDYYQCRYWKDNGERCNAVAREEFGYCNRHKKVIQKALQDVTLLCSHCPAASSCKFKNYKGLDLCYLELFDSSLELRTKEDVEDVMRRTIRDELNMCRRLLRFINQDPTNRELLAEYRQIVRQAVEHVKSYGIYKGYSAHRTVGQITKEQMNVLRQIFKEEKEPEGQVVEESKTVRIGYDEEGTPIYETSSHTNISAYMEMKRASEPEGSYIDENGTIIIKPLPEKGGKKNGSNERPEDQESE